MKEPRPEAGRSGLNPAIKSRTSTTHDTKTPTPPPADSASVQRDEGQGWPALWLVVTVVGAIIVLGLLFL